MPTNVELEIQINELRRLLMEHEHQPLNSPMNFVTRLVKKNGQTYEPLISLDAVGGKAGKATTETLKETVGGQ